MRKFLLIFTYAASLLIVASCHNTNSTSISSVPSVSSLADLDFIEKIETVELDNSMPVSSVHKVAVSDSTVFVLSQEGLNCYDMKGKYLRQISQCGRAENEWLYINTFFLSSDGSSVCLVDGQGDKMLWYDLAGNHIRTAHLEAGSLFSVNNAEEMSDGDIVLSRNLFNGEDNVLTVYGKDISGQKCCLHAGFTSEDVSVPTGIHPFSLFDDKLKVVVPFASKALSFDGEMMSEDFALPLSGRILDKGALAKIHDYSVFKSFELKNDGVHVGYTSIYETKSHYILSYYNLEYLIVDKEQESKILFKPECDLFSDNIESFYDILFAGDTCLISVNNQSVSGKTTLIFYYLR